MDIKLKVGQRIKELRKELELSQEALALKAEVDRTYMTDVENGRRNISIEILEKIIKALEVSSQSFLTAKSLKSNDTSWRYYFARRNVFTRRRQFTTKNELSVKRRDICFSNVSTKRRTI
ncbi:MAG TPA: helix-turn-helix transcriptional regulator [Puia sp.]|nr:helix-turn-helix transcriptional regulator [Puia sp.]